MSQRPQEPVPHRATPEDIRKIAGLIKDAQVCMLTTTNEDGTFLSRPMQHNRKHTFDGTLWFFTYADSRKARNVARSPQVNAGFSDPQGNSYVSITGPAELVRDRQRIEELYQPVLKAWFPDGVDTPGIALLKVTMEGAEYWDSPSGFLPEAISLAKSLLTKEPANPGDNERVTV